MGRDWIIALNLKIPFLNYAGVKTSLNDILQTYGMLFDGELGTFRKGTFKLSLKDEATPVFCKPRPVPFALKDKVEIEIGRLVSTGVLTPVEFSDWGTPIVPVIKSDNSIRICGDYKVTLNRFLNVDRYPLPRIEELFRKLQGGKEFSKIDLSQAYQQVLLDEESKKLVTISTHKGLYQYNRLPYGVSSAPSMFQRLMDQLLQGLEGVICFLDDILITGRNEEEHMQRLNQVLKRLAESGLKVKREKCNFFQKSVEYLGYMINSEGLHVLPDKIKAIKDVPKPQNVTQLKAFLGMVNYYGAFIPNLAKILYPLYKLLNKGIRWNWDGHSERAFNTVKDKLCSAQVLAHYDPSLPVKLSCDASAYGLGAVISHVLPNGLEKPIAYASRTLSKSEVNYSQIDKEA